MTNSVFFHFVDKFFDRFSQAAKYEAAKFYAFKIHPRHFDFSNQFRYGYKPLSSKYEQQKRKKFGHQPILVATGKLKNSKFQIFKNGKILFQLPQYGKYVNSERPFFILNSEDQKQLLNHIRIYLKSTVKK